MPFAPGNKHGRGRPPVGSALAVAVREKWPPNRLLDLVDDLLACDDNKVRLGVLNFLADRGYGKPKETVEIKSDLAPEEYEAELEAITREQLSKMPLEERLKLVSDPAPTDTIQ